MYRHKMKMLRVKSSLPFDDGLKIYKKLRIWISNNFFFSVHLGPNLWETPRWGRICPSPDATALIVETILKH